MSSSRCFPHELVFIICSFSNYTCIPAILSTCKEWFKLSAYDAFWQQMNANSLRNELHVLNEELAKHTHTTDDPDSFSGVHYSISPQKRNQISAMQKKCRERETITLKNENTGKQKELFFQFLHSTRREKIQQKLTDLCANLQHSRTLIECKCILNEIFQIEKLMKKYYFKEDAIEILFIMWNIGQVPFHVQIVKIFTRSFVKHQQEEILTCLKDFLFFLKEKFPKNFSISKAFAEHEKFHGYTCKSLFHRLISTRNEPLIEDFLPLYQHELQQRLLKKNVKAEMKDQEKLLVNLPLTCAVSENLSPLLITKFIDSQINDLQFYCTQVTPKLQKEVAENNLVFSLLIKSERYSVTFIKEVIAKCPQICTPVFQKNSYVLANMKAELEKDEFTARIEFLKKEYPQFWALSRSELNEK